MDNSKLEVWMRGPLPQIIPCLQPVAHALLQAGEEIDTLMQDFDDNLLWLKPAGKASAGFHLQHLQGVLERLFTYARGEALSTQQLQQLKDEGVEIQGINVQDLVLKFNTQLQNSIKQLEQVKEHEVFEPRGIGRAQIPTNVLGLYFHAAEHTMRHLGQLLVTVAVVQSSSKPAI